MTMKCDGLTAVGWFDVHHCDPVMNVEWGWPLRQTVWGVSSSVGDRVLGVERQESNKTKGI